MLGFVMISTIQYCKLQYSLYSELYFKSFSQSYSLGKWDNGPLKKSIRKGKEKLGKKILIRKLFRHFLSLNELFHFYQLYFYKFS